MHIFYKNDLKKMYIYKITFIQVDKILDFYKKNINNNRTIHTIYNFIEYSGFCEKCDEPYKTYKSKYCEKCSNWLIHDFENILSNDFICEKSIENNSSILLNGWDICNFYAVSNGTVYGIILNASLASINSRYNNQKNIFLSIANWSNICNEFIFNSKDERDKMFEEIVNYKKLDEYFKNINNDNIVYKI